MNRQAPGAGRCQQHDAGGVAQFAGVDAYLHGGTDRCHVNGVRALPEYGAGLQGDTLAIHCAAGGDVATGSRHAGQRNSGVYF